MVFNALHVCDGRHWHPTSSACTRPDTDLTSRSYRHWGSGNCPPHYHDQSWLSADDEFHYGQVGWHDSHCPPDAYAVSTHSFAAIEFPLPTVIKRFRVLLHDVTAKKCYFQGSFDSSDGLNGVWHTLYGIFDFPDGPVGTWSGYYTFSNQDAFTVYRLSCPGTGIHALHEWEMFCNL